MTLEELWMANHFLVRLRKDGSYEKAAKKKATHVLTETQISIVATPLKKWPKHKSKNHGYGKPRYEHTMQVPTSKDNKLEIPPGATHIEYSTSRIAIVDTVNHVHDFTGMRGQLRFGKYHRGSDRFEYLDEGTELKEGTCVENKEKKREAGFYDGKEPERIVREHPELPKPPKKTVSQAVVDALAKNPAFQKQPRAPRPAGGESVCGFIDSLIIEGGRTKDEILKVVLAKFPGRDPKSTLSTIGVRPAHIRKAGKVPQPFKK